MFSFVATPPITYKQVIYAPRSVHDVYNVPSKANAATKSLFAIMKCSVATAKNFGLKVISCALTGVILISFRFLVLLSCYNSESISL